MKIRIKNKNKMSSTSYNQHCPKKQRNWWLRGEDGFVDLPGGPYPGDCDISIAIESLLLPAGKYTLGCGPAGRHGVRETITISYRSPSQ